MFNGVKSYLGDLLEGRVSLDPSLFALRASTVGIDVHTVPESKKAAYESSIAAIALKSAESNYRRHAVLQKFLLATDRYTVATEVPVFLTDAETRGTIGKPGGLLGHMDFLQVYEYSALILDYKPDAAKAINAISQLLLCTIALSKRTGVHLKHIRIAWFDEKDYFKVAAMEAYTSFKNSQKK